MGQEIITLSVDLMSNSIFMRIRAVHVFVHLNGCTLVFILVLRFPSLCIHISHITRTSLHDLGNSHTINGKVKTNVYIEKFEDIKGVIRIRKSKDRQHNDQTIKTNNDLQNTTQKTKRSSNTLVTGVRACAPEG